MSRRTRWISTLCWVLAAPFLVSGSTLLVASLRMGEAIALAYLPLSIARAIAAVVASVWLCVGVTCALLPYALPGGTGTHRGRTVPG